MHVLHVIPSLSLVHGGPSFAMPMIARSLVSAGVSLDIATTDDDGPGRRSNLPLGQRIERDGSGVFYFRKQTEFYKVSRPLKRWLAGHVSDYDLVHIHALFSYSSVCAARAARRQGVPYVIRPLGSFNQWCVTNRRRPLKSLSLRFVEFPILRRAAAMHYTSRQEQTEAEATGATARPFVIPLGVDLQPVVQVSDPARFLDRWPLARGRRLVLFLSRIDPIKGLEILLPAFADVRRTMPDACLVIAGDGPPEYVQKCRSLAATVGVSDALIWTGFVQGVEKLAAFAAASIFVLPSHSESFGIAAVEALAAGLPVVTTPGVAIAPDIEEWHAGLVVATQPDAVASAIAQLLGDAGLRDLVGSNARRLAREKYSTAAMGEKLRELYAQVLAPRKT